MTSTGIVEFFTIFVLAVFVGIEVISKVPGILDTPLMAGSNAIHGIILVGTIIVLGDAHGPTEEILGFLAVLLATLNVVGGFVVTDRMLQMFKGKPAGRPGAASGRDDSAGGDKASAPPRPSDDKATAPPATGDIKGNPAS